MAREKPVTMTSPSGELRVVIRRKRWQVQVRERLIHEGAGAQALADALLDVASQGGHFGTAAVEARDLLNRVTG